MEELDQILSKLSERHRAALEWFTERAGEEQHWPEALKLEAGRTLLATRAKGIYKPAWSEYALSNKRDSK